MAIVKDDGTVPMTLRFPERVYYFLEKIADKDRRSMNQEVFFLIEDAAKKMGIKYNPRWRVTDDDIEFYKKSMEEAARKTEIAKKTNRKWEEIVFCLEFMRTYKKDPSWGTEFQSDKLKHVDDIHREILAAIRTEGIDPLSVLGGVESEKGEGPKAGQL